MELETFLDEVVNTELTAFAARFKIGIFNDEVHCFLDKAGGLLLLLCTTYQVDLSHGRLYLRSLLRLGLISHRLRGGVSFLDLLLIIVSSLSVHLRVGSATRRV